MAKNNLVLFLSICITLDFSLHACKRVKADNPQNNSKETAGVTTPRSTTKVQNVTKAGNTSSSLSPKQMRQMEKLQEEVAKRDHHRIGTDQDLFFFHELSPGSCFFTPRGTFIYHTLINYIRTLYRQRGYHEVITPNLYNVKLWQKSGHWDHFAEHMYSFKLNESSQALKPMNCPGHCLMFAARKRSWRELPLRLADFGVLHRNELSGSLLGLKRARRFQQDDAHIFCTTKQIRQEVTSVLDFLKEVYTTLGFTFECNLATRPAKFMGDLAMWDDAEKQLEQSLNEFGVTWKTEAQDGAFYGPKIDITIRDGLNQSYQSATIQLDFQLPIRFDLKYSDENRELSQPVIIHRAILGSIERMIAILAETYAGKWPFWLSPRQATVIPIAPPLNDYAIAVRNKIFEAGFQCDVDTTTGERLNKKIRNAQVEQYNFILVVGEKEKNSSTVNVRTRNEVVHGVFKIEDVISRFEKLKRSRSLERNEF